MEKIKILIVDDEQIVIDSIQKHLRNLTEYEVLSALNVNDALKIIENQEISIILTDLMMPEIDGLEFMKIIQENGKNIVMIMITGYATINTALQAQHLGAFDYLAKPFTKDELIKLINRAASVVEASKNKTEKNSVETKQKLQSGFKGIGENSWFMIEDSGLVILGVERKFLFSIGVIQNVFLPEIGDELRQGSIMFQVFSADLRSESLYAPLSGIVNEVNQEVLSNPNEILQDPYGKGWLLKIKPTMLEAELKILGLK